METRKYFDYELAYKGLKRVEKILATKGIEEIRNQFNYMCGYFSDENEVNFYYEDYNVWVTILNDEGVWYVSNEVEVVSYESCEDTLYIDDIHDINERLNMLEKWAIDHCYSEEDYKAEKKSLENILKLL